jgi:hypothetical protein
MVLTRMEDENGNSLLSGDPTIILQRPANGRLSASIPLKNEAAGKTIAIIEGDVIGEVATRMDEFRLDDLTSLPKELKIGDGGEITVQSLTSEAPWQMVIAVPAQMQRFGGAFMGGGVQGPESLRVLDQHGRPMSASIGGQRGDGANAYMTLTLNSANPDARPTKLHWLAVGQTREAKVPFVLKDLPLP